MLHLFVKVPYLLSKVKIFGFQALDAIQELLPLFLKNVFHLIFESNLLGNLCLEILSYLLKVLNEHILALIPLVVGVIILILIV
jgi:hypothetical protein